MLLAANCWDFREDKQMSFRCVLSLYTPMDPPLQPPSEPYDESIAVGSIP